VLPVPTAAPPGIVVAPQGHILWQLCVPLVIPLRCKVSPPLRHRFVPYLALPFLETLRAASVASTSVATSSDVRCMALGTQPAMLGVTVAGHLVGGGGVVGVPLFGQPGVCGRGLALAEPMPAPAVAVGADYLAAVLRQIADLGLPLVHPAAPVGTAMAPQPDDLVAPEGEIRRLVALVEVWVPPGLDEAVLRVGQGLLAFGIEARCACCGRSLFASCRGQAGRYCPAVLLALWGVEQGKNQKIRPASE